MLALIPFKLVRMATALSAQVVKPNQMTIAWYRMLSYSTEHPRMPQVERPKSQYINSIGT